MKIKVFEKKFKWECHFYGDIIEAKVAMYLVTNRHGIFFLVKVPNKSFTGGFFEVIKRALESQTVGMIKYDRLKSKCIDKKIWQAL